MIAKLLATLKKVWAVLRKPSVHYSLGFLTLGGFIAGVIFEWSVWYVFVARLVIIWFNTITFITIKIKILNANISFCLIFILKWSYRLTLTRGFSFDLFLDLFYFCKILLKYHSFHAYHLRLLILKIVLLLFEQTFLKRFR